MPYRGLWEPFDQAVIRDDFPNQGFDQGTLSRTILPDQPHMLSIVQLKGGVVI
ncbi:hypothetical protein SDC9_153950 [bioreactor metagenome]|uniref:Uncharacterized protein n=1 Tax=bioreactor metagenome TaxID=1076179 RepID=A0A645F257_9ZZZZ